jgi:hypothetical protein
MSQLRRFLGIVVTLALATGTLVTLGVGTASAAPSAELTRYPYLTDLVGTKVTVNWATTRVYQATSTGRVTWGPAGSSCDANAVPATKTSLSIGNDPTLAPQYQWQATINLGAPGTYCYRVLLGKNAPVNPPPTIDLLGSDPSPQFKTQVPAASTEPFSFAVLGDWGEVDSTGANPALANITSLIANSGARFAISTGDNAYNNGSQENYGDLKQTVSPGTAGDPNAVPPVPPTPPVGMSAVFGPNFWAKPGRSIPMFAGIGNHGFARNDAACVSPPDKSKCHPHLQNWPQPTAVATSNGSYKVETYPSTKYGTTAVDLPSAWYAFDAGVARFYMLEAAWPDNNAGSAPAPGGYANDYETHWKPGAAEYEWLKADLAAHPGGVKFAIVHKPFQSDTSSNNEATDEWLRSDGPGVNASTQSLEALLANNGVAMAFTGHAHIYERNEPHDNGPSLVSYVTGGGGAKPESVSMLSCNPHDEYAIAWSFNSNTPSKCGAAPMPSSSDEVFHFLKVTVNGTQVTVTPTNSLGQTFDIQTYNVGAAASSGFLVDGYGGLQPFSVGGAAPLAKASGGPYWNGFDIARGVALLPNKTGGYVLDGWGGLHPFAIGNGPVPPTPKGGPYWKGQDIAKGVAINPDGTGGFIVDGLGGMHGFAIGNNPVPTKPADGPYWPNMNIARGVTLLKNGGGYVVDGYGGLHPFTTHGVKAGKPIGGPYWNGTDIVRGVASSTDGAAGYVADGFGGIHPFDITKKAQPVTKYTGYWRGWDIARGIAL